MARSGAAPGDRGTLRSVDVILAVELQRRRFTVDEYCAMLDTGILMEGDRVELIEGEIIEMASIGSRHAACANRLNQLLVRRRRGARC